MLDDLMSDYQEFIDEKINDTNTILDSIKELLGGNDGIIATLKSLDSSLTNTTKDQIDSSTTNGGDGGQGAKDYVNNTVTNDRNTINSSHKTGLYLLTLLTFPYFQGFPPLKILYMYPFPLFLPLWDNYKGKFIIQLFNRCLPLYQEVLRKSALLPL